MRHGWYRTLPTKNQVHYIVSVSNITHDRTQGDGVTFCKKKYRILTKGRNLLLNKVPRKGFCLTCMGVQ